MHLNLLSFHRNLLQSVCPQVHLFDGIKSAVCSLAVILPCPSMAFQTRGQTFQTPNTIFHLAPKTWYVHLAYDAFVCGRLCLDFGRNGVFVCLCLLSSVWSSFSLSRITWHSFTFRVQTSGNLHLLTDSASDSRFFETCRFRAAQWGQN